MREGGAAAGAAAAIPVSFTLVTGNPDKRAEAERILGSPVDCVPLDLPEPQSLDLLAVLRAKGDEAFRRLRRPVVVEETGLELAALNGFPGPLVKWMLAAVGAEGIARTALALGDARVTARCALLWTDGDREVIGEGETDGTLVHPARGAGGFGWDPVFLPDGEARTYGELSAADKDRLGHRGRAWRDLLAKL
ncbi:MAG TPA: non-canonical purine NTP pyrophosphatase [Thermoanaerobaculia bacterium]|nr:non-canonical purine NTP pyrophosphatase [Thermoanaerobaculia bacterium]